MNITNRPAYAEGVPVLPVCFVEVTVRVDGDIPSLEDISTTGELTDMLYLTAVSPVSPF